MLRRKEEKTAVLKRLFGVKKRSICDIFMVDKHL
jgi:hypothetical protein